MLANQYLFLNYIIMAFVSRNRKFTHCFRNKTNNKNHKMACFNKYGTSQGQKNRLTENNPILAYHSLLSSQNQPHVDYEQTLVLQSDLSQQIVPKLQYPLAKFRFGTYGIDFIKHGTISAKFIDSVRLNIARRLKKTARFWIRLCADTPVTARSAETRMGRGKGAISFWQSKVKPGQTFLEFSKLNPRTMQLIFNDLKKKTPLPIKLVMKH
jgi:large subunit ribosomal protein L16